MSKSENIKAFEKAMSENTELREKFEAAEERIYNNKEAENVGDLMVKAAAEVGFTLDMAELERSFAQSQELSDEELSNVSGGTEAAEKNADWCFYDHHCYMFYRHTEDGSKTAACWDNYNWFTNH